MVLLLCHAKIDGRKEGENIRLNKTDQQLEEQHKNVEGNRNDRRPVSCDPGKLAEDENQDNKTKRNKMPCQHVGKKSDTENQGLDEHAK